MKLSETLQGIGRPVAFYPGLRKITGSTTATILLCQLFYWTGKEASGDGWIYKTSDELTEETGLSYDEQVTARKHLVEHDLIEEEYKRLEHKMYFRVCMETINAVWEIPETGIAKMGKAVSTVSTKAALPNSLNGTTETTTENTQREIDNEPIAKKLSDEKFPFNPNTGTIITIWKDDFEDDVIIRAIEQSISHGARTITYVDKILIGWKANGVPPTREEQIAKAKKSGNNYSYGEQYKPIHPKPRLIE